MHGDKTCILACDPKISHTVIARSAFNNCVYQSYNYNTHLADVKQRINAQPSTPFLSSRHVRGVQPPSNSSRRNKTFPRVSASSHRNELDPQLKFPDMNEGPSPRPRMADKKADQTQSTKLGDVDKRALSGIIGHWKGGLSLLLIQSKSIKHSTTHIVTQSGKIVSETFQIHTHIHTLLVPTTAY